MLMKKFYVLCDLVNGGLETLYFKHYTEWVAYYRANEYKIHKVIKYGYA